MFLLFRELIFKGKIYDHVSYHLVFEVFQFIPVQSKPPRFPGLKKKKKMEHVGFAYTTKIFGLDNFLLF